MNLYQSYPAAVMGLDEMDKVIVKTNKPPKYYLNIKLNKQGQYVASSLLFICSLHFHAFPSGLRVSDGNFLHHRKRILRKVFLLWNERNSRHLPYGKSLRDTWNKLQAGRFSCCRLRHQYCHCCCCCCCRCCFC